jgi:hypothetical protein
MAAQAIDAERKQDRERNNRPYTVDVFDCRSRVFNIREIGSNQSTNPDVIPQAYQKRFERVIVVVVCPANITWRDKGG